jgi:hypothetical protein
VIPDAVRAAYLQLDFSDVIAECDRIPMGDPEFLGAWRADSICVEDLTPAEQQMLTTFRIKGHKAKISPSWSALYVRGYRAKYGTMPRDGLDIMSMIAPSYLSEKGWKAFSAMTKAEQASHAFLAINPATGKIYDSFTKPGYPPFSIRFRKMTGEGSTDRWPVPIYHKETKSSTFEDRNVQGMECIVYGEKKGRMILKQISWKILGDDGLPK